MRVWEQRIQWLVRGAAARVSGEVVHRDIFGPSPCTGSPAPTCPACSDSRCAAEQPRGWSTAGPDGAVRGRGDLAVERSRRFSGRGAGNVHRLSPSSYRRAVIWSIRPSAYGRAKNPVYKYGTRTSSLPLRFDEDFDGASPPILSAMHGIGAVHRCARSAQEHLRDAMRACPGA